MVRFSFARDCGSIPHGDSTKHVFQYHFSLKLKTYIGYWLIVKSILFSFFAFDKKTISKFINSCSR